jgi:hypothetical protein
MIFPYNILDGKTVEEIIQLFQSFDKTNIVETYDKGFTIIDINELDDSFGL